MSDERPESPRPSWRDRSGSRPPDEAARAERGWRRRTTTPGAPGGSRRWLLRLAAASGFFLMFAALAVALIFLLRPNRPADLVLVGADYATNLTVPHNVEGLNGLAALERLARPPRTVPLLGPTTLRLVRKRMPLERPEEWDALIEDLKSDRALRGPQALILAVSLHGTSDAEGAYLLPNQMSRAEDRIPLRRVIESMGELPADKPKLLILEPALVPADWRQGMIQNDFARRLRALGPEIAGVRNLWVMTGSGVDQRGWTSDGLGRTAFGHYLVEGLRGKAADSGGRLTLSSLFGFVQRNVREWSWSARGAIQEPMLLPEVPRQTIFLAMPGQTPDDPPPAAPGRDALERAWQAFRQLDGLAPHPSAYSPRRWRDYRAALVRHEELVRSGAASAAAELAARLASLERRLRADRLLRLPSSGESTLAMNAVQGGRVDDPSPDPAFNKFWTAATDAERAQVWRSLTQAPPGDARPDADRDPSLRSRIDDYLYRRAVEAPASNLAPSAARLRLTRGIDFPQPAEVHFARMLDRSLDPAAQTSRSWALVGQALRVRLLAEQAAVAAAGKGDRHAYSERVHPWTRPLIDQADQQRRLGEDLLLSTLEQDRTDSRQALDRAEALYREAARRNDAIRDAQETRDRAFAELPDYARWAARRHLADLDDDLPAKLDAIWASLHELDRLLEEQGGGTDLAPVAEPTRAVADAFGEVRKRFADQRLEIDRKRLPGDWEAATAAARVAFADAPDLALRRTIWDRLDNIRQSDLELAQSTTRPAPTAAEQEAATSEARRRARIEGLMAVASLGQGWFDDGRFAGRSEYAAVRSRLEPDPDPAGDEWPAMLASVGDETGLRWSGMAAAIDELGVEDEGIPNLAGLRDRLAKAGRLDRRAAALASFRDGPAAEPTARRREVQVHDLLIALARRAWLDHWFDEDPDERPYYQVAGGRFLDDAARLVPGSPDAGSFRAELEKKSRLDFDDPEPRILTSERSLEIGYRLAETGTVPPGVPVVRADGESLLQVEAGGTSYRAILREESKAGQAIPFTVFSPLVRQAETEPARLRPTAEAATFAVQGLFRGQPFERRTPVLIHPLPGVVATGPAPLDRPEASLTVRADPDVIERFGEGAGAIAIVVDCSGSMVEPVRTKFEEAKKALAAMLRTVPRGTRLSILTFGQADEGFIREFPREKDQENQKRPELTIRTLRQPGPWDIEQLDGLMAQFEQLQPFHGTPLLRAMWGAKLQLDQAEGLKTLVVLTDGKDTRFTEDREFNPKGTDIPTFIRTYFKGTGIQVNMVLFKVVDSELAETRQQFEAAIGDLDLPGKLFTVQDFDRLVQTLKSSVQQRLTCRLLSGGGREVGSIDVTGPGEADRWTTKGLAPGSYTLEVAAGFRYDRGVDLEAGDRLIVKLVLTPDGRIGFERGLYSDDDRGRKEPRADSDGWRLAVMANRGGAGADGRLDLLSVLEPLRSDATPDDRDPLPLGPGPLRQVEPSLVWFAIDPLEAAGRYQVRWQLRAGYPGPVFQLAVPEWVADPSAGGPARPVLRAWWSTDATLPLDASLNFDNPEAVDRATLRATDGTTAIIESIRVEDHAVEVRPGSAPETVSCLVVRLAHPIGKPFLVDPGRLGGIRAERYEHRLYPEAGKSVSLFWPVTRSQAEANLRSLGLISVDGFRRQAESRQQSLELKLMPPRPEDRLPEPPAALLD